MASRSVMGCLVYSVPCCVLVIITIPAVTKAQLVFERQETKVALKIEDTNADVDFSFKNKGNQAVLIKKIETSCGCTSATSDKQIYLPGDTGKISAIVKIGSFHGDMEKTVLVQTDDPTNHNTKLTIHISVPSLVELSTSTLQWTEGTEYNQQSVTVKVEDTMPLKITGLKPWSEKINASLTVAKEGKEYRVTVKPAGGTKSMISAVELITDIVHPDLRKQIWLLVRIDPAASTRPDAASTQPYPTIP